MTDRNLLPPTHEPMDESDLRAMLDRSLADVRAPDRVHDTALATGRRLRTRRHAGQVATGVLAAAACTAVVAATVGGSDGTADPGFAGDPTPATSQLPSQVPSPGPDPSQTLQDDPPPGWWDMPSGRMVAALKDLLPDGVTVATADRYLEGTSERTMAAGSLLGVLSGPTGPGAFQVLLYSPDPESIASDGSPSLSERTRCRAYMTTCEPVLDDSGTAVGRVSSDEESGTTYYDVMLLGPDGGGLYFYIGDSSGEKPGYEPPSAEAPPLSPAQLLELAQDPAWTDYDPEG